MNQDEHGEIRRYVVITQALLGATDINSNEKIVLAYISSYEEYFASNKSTGEFLGLSERIVERAKQKLTRLDYIRIIKETGRGNVYAFNLERLAKNGGADAPKLANQTCQNWRTESKEKLQRKEKGAEAPNDQKFGREDINELVELWEAQTGIAIKGQKQQRYALANLIKSRGYEATKALIMAVGDTRRVNDRFAPQIATPRELTGKYSKLERLLLWQERNKTARPFGQAPRIPEYKEPEPEPEIKRASHEQIEAMRAKLGFKKGAAS